MKKRIEEIRMRKSYQKSKLLLLVAALGFGTVITFTGCGVKEKIAERESGRTDTVSTISLGKEMKENITEKTNFPFSRFKANRM